MSRFNTGRNLHIHKDEESKINGWATTKVIATIVLFPPFRTKLLNHCKSILQYSEMHNLTIILVLHLHRTEVHIYISIESLYVLFS